MPESEISVVTPNEFMVGMVSFSDIASAKSFPLFEQEGNKINITATKNAAVMFIRFMYDFECSFKCIII